MFIKKNKLKDNEVSMEKIKSNIEVKNIDEFNDLVGQIKKDVDKLMNFKFEVETTQCEQSH